MQFMNDPFGMQQYGQQQFGQGGFGGAPMSMGGPSGFAGNMPQLGAQPGDGMFGADPKKKKNGFNPLMMMLSPLMGMMMHNPKSALTALSPLAGMMGAFK